MAINTLNTSLRFSFRKKEHINKRKEIRKVLEVGQKVFFNNFLMYVYVRNDNSRIRRLAVVVSKKHFKNAIKRNKFKRRVREVFRLNKNKIKYSTDIIVLSTKESYSKTYKDIEFDFISCLKKCNVYIE